jgi:hypothetical protein
MVNRLLFNVCLSGLDEVREVRGIALKREATKKIYIILKLVYV